MKKLQNKQDVSEKLSNSGINICLTRSAGINCFYLITEHYGHFAVNAMAGTDFEKVREFTSTYNNITITVNN